MNGTKFKTIVRIGWESGLAYRVNVLMWRLRNLMRFFTVYFFWIAAFSNAESIYTYNREEIITYVFLSTLLFPFIFATRTDDVAGEIATGELANYLLKPVKYFWYWVAREFADKSINVSLGLVEIIILYLIFKPSILFPGLVATAAFSISLLLAIILYFLIGFSVSLLTFWYREANGWPIRFLFFTIITSISGSYFPLDILPGWLYRLTVLLPTAYVTYIPAQIWLGRVSGAQVVGVYFVMIAWILIFYRLITVLWKKGIKIYESEGR